MIRRTTQALIVLALAYTLAYVLLAALPGDAIVARYASPDLGLSPQQLADIRAAYGYDRPLAVRYVESAAAFLRGDLGYSVQSGAAVGTLLAAAFPSTFALAFWGLLVAVVLSVAIALAATHGPTGVLRRLAGGLPPLFISLPVFWIGIILIQVFSFRLGLIPVFGASGVQSLLLPVATLAVPLSAPLAQVLIQSIDEVRAQPFVAVVRARGASTAWLVRRNIARNALLPVLTIAGLLFGELIGGAVVTETVFGRAGIGQLTAQAVQNRDAPVLLAVVVLSAVAFVVVNLLVDLAYPLLDPRLRRRVLR